MDEELARKLAEHDTRFDEHDERFDRIERKLGEHDEQFLRIGIKLEKIEDDIRLWLEGVHLQIDALRRDVGERLDEINERLDRLEHVVQPMNRDLVFTMTAVQEIAKSLRIPAPEEPRTVVLEDHTQQIQELRDAVARIDAKLDDDDNRARVDAIEARVAALEAEMNKVPR